MKVSALVAPLTAAAHSLRVARSRQRTILRFGKETFHGALQHGQLMTEKDCTFLRQGLDQIFQHGAQAPGNLYAGATELTNLGDRQLNEVLPVWCAIDEAYSARLVAYFLKTTPRQRENHLLVMWGLLLLPVVFYSVRLLAGL